MPRQLDAGVIEAFCHYVEDTEVPPIFAVWSAVVMVSAALGRSCFMDFGYYTIYPNLYVVLIGPSGTAKKSTPIKIATGFMQKVRPPINLLSQKMTPEGLIMALSGLSGDVGGQKIIPSAIGVAVVSELATLLDKNSFKSGMVGLLTDLYDAGDFSYLTRARGLEVVRNPCLSIIGGSTPHWIKECIPPVSIGGGFTSRIVFVYSKGREKLIPRPALSEANRKRGRCIMHDLNAVAKLRGMFAMTSKALKMYDEEYIDFKTSNSLIDDPNLGGYAGRRADILTKVAMAVSASRKDSKIIDVDDLTVAITLLKKAEKTMPMVMKTIASKEVGDIFEQIISFLVRHKSVKRSELVGKFRHKMTSQELDQLIQTLHEEGVLRVDTNIQGRKQTVVYTFVGKKE